MVKVLEEEVKENGSDRLWRIVLSTTAEIVGSTPYVIDDYTDYTLPRGSSASIPQETRIVTLKDAGVIAIDPSRKDTAKSGIFIHPIQHRVNVYDQSHFDLAYQLAQAYEQRLGNKEEFTLKKHYSNK